MEIKLVTTNQGKWMEFEKLIRREGIKLKHVKAAVKEIQSSSVEDIARSSAEEALALVGEGVLVEDAGLFIDALKGFPGPYSSYVYSTIGHEGVLRLMEGVEARTARFVSALAYASREAGVKVFVGECRGVIARCPAGSSGFGFDPIFIPEEGDGRTFAEMSIEEKNRISHRARSAAKFLEWYTERASP